ncbi:MULTISPECIES: type II toxin-antitoxin system prevent-host-death family antitoxin [unclassified Candidatus Tisiphia]|uniref:type II toxin-antitoxin system Phd/YefM family antitoxin n=1 Tax=unclassified Candidatus Tisiphia TaxID=2996318 RepID=UPI00312C6E26
MNVQTISVARANLFSLVQETNETHKPVYLKGKHYDAVLLSREDYESLQATLELYSIPGLVKEILKARQEPLDECLNEDDMN